MNYGKYLFLTLIFASGCDFHSILAPSAPPTNSSPRQGGQVIAPTPEESQLIEIEQSLLEQPDNINLLKTKALLLQGRAEKRIQNGDRASGYGDYEASGELWRKIKSATPELSRQDAIDCARALYNLACALSLKRQIDPALAALREAVVAGFSNMERFENDTDLDPLRDEAGFRALLKEIPELRLITVKDLIAADSLFSFEFSLRNLQDKTVALEDYRGKVLIVDVWGTWCGPCRQEIPSLVTLHRKFKDRGFEIVGINYERVEEAPKWKQIIKDFCTQNKIAYECVIGDDETQQRIPGFGGYPTKLLIDRTGIVRAKLEGPQTYETLESMVELLLAEPESSLK